MGADHDDFDWLEKDVGQKNVYPVFIGKLRRGDALIIQTDDPEVEKRVARLITTAEESSVLKQIEVICLPKGTEFHIARKEDDDEAKKALMEALV